MSAAPVDLFAVLALALLLVSAALGRRRRRGEPITDRATESGSLVLSDPSAGGRGVSAGRKRTTDGAVSSSMEPTPERLTPPPASTTSPAAPAAAAPAARPAAPAGLPALDAWLAAERVRERLILDLELRHARRAILGPLP